MEPYHSKVSALDSCEHLQLEKSNENESEDGGFLLITFLFIHIMILKKNNRNPYFSKKITHFFNI